MNLNQITVPVMDVPRSIRFYSKLGLKLIVEALPEYARFELPEGEATFSLHRVDSLPTGEGIWVYFETERLDARVAELQQEGLQFEELPEDKRWLWREARLRDPDGNLLILYHAGPNRKEPPWRIE
ncbi:MAG: VOC family protein [Bacteroidetes bacterium]|jgi:catechol 2,3-dioxygenase-like lactoylglutathione lyase family enzyme|nr:MAG: VOC family protein [Bacteroidota bacterium]UCE69677.1 MAG: VOC family protein [Flavobacteriaceae bacterium]